MKKPYPAPNRSRNHQPQAQVMSKREILARLVLLHETGVSFGVSPNPSKKTHNGRRKK